MSTGRLSSMIPSTQIVAAYLLLAAFLPSAKAWCDDNGDGFETCYGISNTGIYVASIVGAFVLLCLISTCIAYRRRRINRENLALIQQVRAAQAAQAGGGVVGVPLQHPPQTLNGAPGSESAGQTMTAVTLQYYIPADTATAAPQNTTTASTQSKLF